MIYLLLYRRHNWVPSHLFSIAIYSLYLSILNLFSIWLKVTLYIFSISILNVTAIVPVVVAWGGTQAAAAAAGYATLLRWTAGIIRSVVSRSGEV